MAVEHLSAALPNKDYIRFSALLLIDQCHFESNNLVRTKGQSRDANRAREASEQ
jgi:hypothetical protein